jgi:release factor glutamine methyltransferase
LTPVLARAVKDLAAAGVASPRVDAELLAAHVLGVGRGRLPLIASMRLDERDRFAELLARRIAREPLQHLVGTAAFRYLEVAVGPGVFVPRPETELLAGWGIDAARAVDGVPVVVDLCSGSGAIALSVANEVRTARVTAVERADDALGWLRRNAADRAGAGDPPIEVVQGDVTDPGVLAALTGTVDVVLCNPPYVPGCTPVPREVLEFDPAEAVFGGADGLEVIGPVVALAATLLRPGGVVGIEHDDVHGLAVPDLLRADGRFTDVAGHEDLTGRPRYATARRTA